MKPYGKFSRGVSVVGVGCTPFMDLLTNEKYNGLSEGELYGYAAIEAMQDAGITPKDLQGYIHGQAGPTMTSDYSNANVQVNDWFGAKGLGSITHSEACCTGFFGLDLGAWAVASGKYDYILTAGIDCGITKFAPEMPAHIRERLHTKGFASMVRQSYDRAYTRYTFKAGEYTQFDDAMAYYKQKYGLTNSIVDDALNMLTINNRRAAARNPLAQNRREFDDIAREAGFDNAMDYLRSDNNFFCTEYLRRFGMESRADGAAGCILCPTELAKEKDPHPIEIIGVGNVVYEAMTPHLEVRGTREACQQAYEMAGIGPDEIDLVLGNDFFISSDIVMAEESGYIPAGKAFEYAIEGRTAFDGDKPMITNGGRCSFGHAHGASGFADLYEAVLQMRGEAGEHQIAKVPKTVLLRGFGGGAHNLCAIILRRA